MNDNFNPIILNGKILSEKAISPNRFGGDDSKKYKRSFEESQEMVLNRIESIEKEISKISDDYVLDFFYLELNFPNEFLAKSYQVKSVYKSAGLDLVGSSNWKDKYNKNGRSDYVVGNKKNIKKFKQIVKYTDYKSQKLEIRRIDDLNLLKPIVYSDEKYNKFELVFHKIPIEDLSVLLEKFCLITKLKENDFTYYINEKQDLFICCKLDSNQLEKLKKFNPLRSCTPINTDAISSGVISEDNSMTNNYEIKDISLNNLPHVGMIDGGVLVNGENDFKAVTQLYESSHPVSQAYQEHGTSVASILLFGDLKPTNVSTKLEPSFVVDSIRALPSDENDNFDLIELDKMILNYVREFPDTKVWNISIGPVGPVIDEVISSITRIVDELAYDLDIVFVIAAGNTGDQTGISRRIQSPGDSVNNITVISSYFDQKGKMIPSAYNSIGLGREGAKLKPDIMDHGGLIPIDPIYTFSTYDWRLNCVCGTSFAAPNLARKLALLLNKHREISVWDARALMENFMRSNKKNDDNDDVRVWGKGNLTNAEENLLLSNKDETRILYSNKISAKSYVKIPIPMPTSTKAKTVKITYTIVTKTKVNPDYPDKYTEYGIEDTFYPDDSKFLKNDSKYPSSNSAKYMDESDRRSKEKKWDTIKTKTITKRISSLNNPFLRLHGISRSSERDQITYSLVINIKFMNDTGEAFESILAKYSKLKTVNIKQNLSGGNSSLVKV